MTQRFLFSRRLVFEKMGEGPKFDEKKRGSAEKGKNSGEKPEDKVDLEANKALVRLEKILGKSFYRRGFGDSPEVVDVVDKVTGSVQNFDVRFVSSEKISVRLFQHFQSKKSFFGETRVVNSETLDMKDLLIGNVPAPFKSLTDELLRREQQIKLRESNRLIEDGDSLKSQITKCYDDAMDQLINAKDSDFMTHHKSVEEFRSHFNDRFMKVFLANAQLADFKDNITAKAKGITVIYKRGNSSSVKISPAFGFSDEHYANLDGMFALKRADIAKRHEEKHAEEKKKT